MSNLHFEAFRPMIEQSVFHGEKNILQVLSRNSSPYYEYPLINAYFEKETKNHNRLATVAGTLEYFREIVLECFIGNLKI